MSNQHTQEPWAVSDEVFDNDGTPETVITGLDGRAAIAVTLDFGLNNLGMREANARRIVACINACADISTEGLEATVLENSTICKLMNEQTVSKYKVERKLFEAEKQRDELLAACESAKEWLKEWASAEPYLSILDAAIAKAKGGAA